MEVQLNLRMRVVLAQTVSSLKGHMKLRQNQTFKEHLQKYGISNRKQMNLILAFYLEMNKYCNNFNILNLNY